MTVGKKWTSYEGGFTLVELMVTMSILAILVGIAVLTMSISKGRAQTSSCKANLRTIVSALQQYHALHEGKYPLNLDVLITENYLKSSFNWQCPSGDLKTGSDTASGDYRNYYNSVAGTVSCPRLDHNP